MGASCYTQLSATRTGINTGQEKWILICTVLYGNAQRARREVAERP